MARAEAIHTMCLGHGMCKEIAPQVYRLDKWGCVEIIKADLEPDELPLVREAVYRCPAKALLVDEG